MRIVVIGSSCAGKSTLSRTLAAQLSLAHLELDALFWEPNWVEADPTVFKSRVSEALTVERWVVDGNYTSKIQDLVWQRAEMIIWLDPPLRKILWRFFFRSIGRSWKRELLWNGCRESLRNSIFQKNSLFLWILKTHGKKRQHYAEALKQSAARVVRLRSANEVRDFVSSMGG